MPRKGDRFVGIRLLYVLPVVVVLLLGWGAYQVWWTYPTRSLTQLADNIKAEQVEQLSIQGDQLIVRLRDRSQYQVYHDQHVSLYQTFAYLGIPVHMQREIMVEVRPQRLDGVLRDLLVTGLPLVLIAAMFVNVIRHTSGSNPKTERAKLGKSAARLVPQTNVPSVTFAQVAGTSEAKHELQEIVEFLKRPQRFERVGARMPKGVLMVGPPGTGKTLMARAIAGEAGVPFFSTTGSEFVEMYAGIGASRVRDLFARATRHAPAIIFIDELDSVGRSRGSGTGNSSDEREQTLNQILTEMDGFDNNQGIVVIAATNRADVLDAALLRPGRFDRQVQIELPDVATRGHILQHYLRDKTTDADVTIETLVKQTPGFSGADLSNMINEAAILAARRDRTSISAVEFQESIERVLVGAQRHARPLTADQKAIIAYHEAGHALTMIYQPGSDTVHKITILGRGSSLGYIVSLPEEDRVVRDQEFYRANLVSLLGGRAAERLIFQRVTSSARDDIDRATQLAYAMVTQYGMSDAIGPMSVKPRQGGVRGTPRSYSQTLIDTADHEAQRLLHEAEQTALTILSQHQDALHRVAQTLVARETLSASEIEELLKDNSTI